MAQTVFVPVFRFSTLDFPEKDRFHAWVRGNLCDCRFDDGGSRAFDAQATGAALGPFVISGRHWPKRKHPMTYEVRRTERRIRLDGHDAFRFTLVLGGQLFCRTGSPLAAKTAGELYVLDVAQINECTVEAGDVISLVVPRDMLPSHTALLHGHTLSSGIGRLFADHLLSLYRNLSSLSVHEIPYVVQATLQLLTAAVCPTAEAVREASSPIHDALLGRIQRYIDMHLLESDLTPERICRDIGLSRAKLYQLFEDHGGVMRQIRRKRLRRAYQVLTDLSRPRARIAEIAWSHGFPDEKYFYRLFKAEFGHTPNETLESVLGPNLSPNEVTSGHRLNEVARPAGWTLPFGVFNS